MARTRTDLTLLGDQDLYLFNEGSHLRLYDHLGAHLVDRDGLTGVQFAVWAPSARSVSVIGEFNSWNPESNPLAPRGQSGIWEGFVEGIGRGTAYKYRVVSQEGAYRADKADPFATHAEVAPNTASIVWPLDYEWQDAGWMANRHRRNSLEAPWSVYEMHVGSWMRDPYEGNRSLSWAELAPRVAAHAKGLGFTHVELLPVMEHPFFGSWGYQSTGYFAPSSRYGTPQDFMAFVDHLHQEGLGVILDWVPSHFPSDEHGLGYFDGTHLYEHADPRLGFHPDWNSYIFNYGRHEVRSFLLSSAIFWLDRYHVDGIRVDAVASMLYLDYSRRPGEWVPNNYGGRENLEAIDFLRRLNAEVYRNFPDVQTIAEESTAWPMVSRPLYTGGLGFGMKWDMGWMHDTLDYFSHDPVHRKFHHDELTFRQVYAFSENYMLPLSHDEVVHGKGSLIRKMAGDEWQKFANLRLLLGYMFAEPGKKLLFMGAELGQWTEWAHDSALDWALLQFPLHAGLAHWLSDLNHLYTSEPAMHVLDFKPEGFSWIDCNDWEQSILSLIRYAPDRSDCVVAAFNFTPVPRPDYRIGVPGGGFWREMLNSDAAEYGGSGMGNLGGIEAEDRPWHARSHSIPVTLPPLGAVFLKREAKGAPEAP